MSAEKPAAGWSRVAVPLPSFEGRVEVRIGDRLTVVAEEGRIVFQLRGHTLSLSERAHAFDVMMAAIICSLLLDRGIDVFKMLEEGLGAPGLLGRTKLFILTLASILTRDLDCTRLEEELAAALRSLREEGRREREAARRALELLETTFQVPVPPVDEEAMVGLAAKTPWRPPEVLRQVFGEREVRKVAAAASEDSVKINQTIILGRETTLYELILAASYWSHLLRQGVDFLARLEAALEKPGLYNDLRALFKLILSAIGEEA